MVLGAQFGRRVVVQVSGRPDCLLARQSLVITILVMQVLGDGEGAKEVATTSRTLSVGGTSRGQREKRLGTFGKVPGQG